MPADDVINIPVPGDVPGTVPDPGATMPLDPTIDKVLDQAFAKSHQVGLQAADRHSAGNDNVAELTRHYFLKESQQVGVREAAAMQRMDQDKLSMQILQTRAASVQPTVAGTTVAPGAPAHA